MIIDYLKKIFKNTIHVRFLEILIISNENKTVKSYIIIFMKKIKISFTAKLQFLRCITMSFLKNINIYDKEKTFDFMSSRLYGTKMMKNNVIWKRGFFSLFIALHNSTYRKQNSIFSFILLQTVQKFFKTLG